MSADSDYILTNREFYSIIYVIKKLKKENAELKERVERIETYLSLNNIITSKLPLAQWNAIQNDPHKDDNCE